MEGAERSTARQTVDQTWSLKAALRRLWSDHVIWTRGYVVAALAGTTLSERLAPVAGSVVAAVGTAIGGVISLAGDGDAAAVRLLKNQEDIGQALVPFYGQDAGGKLTYLLKQHIMIAVQLIAAAKSGDQQAFQDQDARWKSNAIEIADLLAAANPNWSKSDVVDLLHQHLSLTKQEVVARLDQNWGADVDAFDQIFTEILTVSDVLSDGIMKQFPERGFTSGEASPHAHSLRLALGRLWSDHVIWTRQYLVAAVADGPDKEQAASRLLKNQEDIGVAMIPFYGEKAGVDLTDLLKQHIQIAVDIIGAAKNGETEKLRESNERWNRNADQIASLLSTANPNWSNADLRDLLMQHLNLTRDEVTARLEKRHGDDVAAFDQIFTEVLTVADVLANGIVKQFPDRFQA